MPRLLCPWDLQARILEWIAIHASRGSSNLKIKPTSLMCPALQADALHLILHLE